MSLYQQKPYAFFDLVVHDILSIPGLTGASAGYENNKFRNDDLAEYLIEWLPDFALRYSDLEEFNSGNGRRMLRKAAQVVYTSPKYKARGEFGELLLHALLREVFDSEPAISKMYYKTALNDTVKGFDAVHIVDAEDGLELWLGEVKFYNKDGKRAVTDIAKEIVEHTDYDYLKNEFLLIDNKVDAKWPHAESLRDLISKRKSLDEVFERVCIPALITYESKCVAEHKKVSGSFRHEICAELRELHKTFTNKTSPNVRIHLFLVPLERKSDLIQVLDKKLKGMQT